MKKAPFKFLIYGLVDPRTLLIRYVGRSSSGFTHPKTYTRPSGLKSRSYRSNWIKELIAAGFCCEIVVLEGFSSADSLNDAEKWWIAYGRLSAWPLVNLTDGGEGLSGYKLPPETKAKIGLALKGRIATPEARAANARAQRGRKHSEETRRKMSRSAKDRFASHELREHMRHTSTGYKHTPEAKAKMRKPCKRPHPPRSNEVRRRLREFALKRSRNAKGAFQ